MYFPYLRGKQNELIALRELLARDLLSQNIIPIVEPVSLTPTLVLTLQAFKNANRKIAIVINPNVGAFYRDCANAVDPPQSTQREAFFKLIEGKNVIKSVIMTSTVSSVINELENSGTSADKLLVIHNNPNYFKSFSDLFSHSLPEYVLMPNDPSFVSRVLSNRVNFCDHFTKQSKNEDYQDTIDEFFSEDCTLYPNHDFVGFADYSVVGRDFTMSGFAPKAVAIHIVYFAKKGIMRIRHFVSTSNGDIDDPAGKFSEAVTELVNWYNNNKETVPLTFGLKMFIQHHNNGTFPALGPVKKLSIMHHLEVIGRYLDSK